MGHLSLFLLLSLPFFSLGDSQFSFFDSEDSSDDFEVETNREERSQSPYYGPFSSNNQVAENTQNHQSLPQYEVSIPEEASVEGQTTSIATVPTFKEIFGFSLAEITKKETDALRGYLIQLNQNGETANFINEHIDSNVCISTLDEMIELVVRGAKLIENTGENLEILFTTLISLRDTRDIGLLIRGAANLLVQLDKILPKFETFAFFARCKSTDSQGIQALRDQAQILYRLSLVPDFRFTKKIKANLLQSAIITEAVTNFLEHVQERIARRDCFSEKSFLGDGTYLAAEIMDDMAEVFGVLGYLPIAKETRQYAVFTRSVAANLIRLKKFRVADDCSPGALLRAAGRLSDLANLIDEVGLVELGISMGLVFRLDLLPDSSH